MRVTVNEVSSHLCKMLTLIIVRTYLPTGETLPQNLLKLSKAYVNVQSRIRFPLDAQVEMGFIIEIMPNFQHEYLYSPSLTCFK